MITDFLFIKFSFWEFSPESLLMSESIFSTKKDFTKLSIFPWKENVFDSSSADSMRKIFQENIPRKYSKRVFHWRLILHKNHGIQEIVRRLTRLLVKTSRRERILRSNIFHQHSEEFLWVVLPQYKLRKSGNERFFDMQEILEDFQTLENVCSTQKTFNLESNRFFSWNPSWFSLFSEFDQPSSEENFTKSNHLRIFTSKSEPEAFFSSKKPWSWENSPVNPSIIPPG